MKALSVKQPWAWLIANGYQDIENSDVPIGYKGMILIHALSRVTGHDLIDGYAAFHEKPPIGPSGRITFGELKAQCGGIVGIAEIVGCVTRSESPWFKGKYGIVFRNARPLPFFPYKGRGGLFEVKGYTLEGDGIVNVT